MIKNLEVNLNSATDVIANIRYLLTFIDDKEFIVKKLKNECEFHLESFEENAGLTEAKVDVLRHMGTPVEEFLEIQTDPASVDLPGMCRPDDIQKRLKKRGRPAAKKLEIVTPSGSTIGGEPAENTGSTVGTYEIIPEEYIVPNLEEDDATIETVTVLDANGLMQLIMRATSENKLTLVEVNEIIKRIADVDNIPAVLQMPEMFSLIAAEILCIEAKVSGEIQ